MPKSSGRNRRASATLVPNSRTMRPRVDRLDHAMPILAPCARWPLVSSGGAAPFVPWRSAVPDMRARPLPRPVDLDQGTQAGVQQGHHDLVVPGEAEAASPGAGRTVDDVDARP